MVPTKIDLEKYRGNNSTLYTGRNQGEAARIELDLNNLDNNDELYTFSIPKGTSSFNPSFYLGLLFESIKSLGIDKFEKKYSFILEEDKNLDIIRVLTENLEDGRRHAVNTIQKKNNFSKFF
jgi:hypothetical protein